MGFFTSGHRKGKHVVKFHAFSETEAFVNVNGHFAITQQEQFGKDPVVVTLPRAVAVAIAKKILEEAERGELVDFQAEESGDA